MPPDNTPDLIEPNDPNAGLPPAADDAADLEDDGNQPDPPATPAPAPASSAATPAPAAADDNPDATPGDGKPGTGVMIPKNRFDEVNARLRDLEAQNALLTQAVRANQPPPPPAAPAPPPTPAFDLVAAQREQLAALAAGEDDKALELSQKINAHLMETATKNALEEFERRQRTQTEAQMKADLEAAVKETVAKYPELDHTAEGGGNADARLFCVGKRDQLIAEGVPWGQALRQAADATAKLFGFQNAPSAAPTAALPTSGGLGGLKPDLRVVASRERNAAAAGAQPGNDAGLGNRATNQARYDVRNLSDEALMALPAAELARLDGSA